MSPEQAETIERKSRTVALSNMIFAAISRIPMDPQQASEALIYLGIVMRMAAVKKDLDRDVVYEIDHEARHLIETMIAEFPTPKGAT